MVPAAPRAASSTALRPPSHMSSTASPMLSRPRRTSLPTLLRARVPSRALSLALTPLSELVEPFVTPPFTP